MHKKLDCIITITDGLSPTSMPFNEFVMYRLKNRTSEKQVLIQVFEKSIDSNIEIPNTIELYSVGLNVFKLAKVIKQLDNDYNIKAFHIHEGKSVIIFSVATLFTQKKKIVYTIHSTYKNYPLHNKIFCFIASFLASRVSCVSKTSYKYYPSLLKRILSHKVKAIQNGVDLERIKEVEKRSNDDTLGNEVFTITYVARLVNLKRHDFLLEIINSLPDINLELIGIGPLEETLKERCKELGIQERVKFKGLISREEVYKHLKMTDLYVSTSSYEGLPIGVLEAMGCRAISMVSDIEQHKEIAKSCPSLITLPMEIDTWIKSINSIRNLTLEERRSIGQQNYIGVKEHFSLESMHKNYDKLYVTLKHK